MSLKRLWREEYSSKTLCLIGNASYESENMKIMWKLQNNFKQIFC